MNSIAVTVIIPTFNGDRYLGEVFAAIGAQDFDGEVEVLVIDSGSTDRTLEIVSAHPAVLLHEIPNSDFGHGRTRNLGARMARGRIVAFLTQDAIPGTQHWLDELTAPLRDAAVAGVVGRQVPRRGCFPLLKYEIIDTFRALGPDHGTTITSLAAAGGDPDLERLGFYSDVNAASRRDFLLEVIPYRDLPYSEDAAFGRDVILAGYSKAYAGDGVVVHSNDLTLHEYGKRIFDEITALRRIGTELRAYGPVARLARWGWGVLHDSGRILRDPDYRFGERLGWLARNPAYHLAKWRNYARAMSADLDDPTAIRRYSLEAERARGPQPDTALRRPLS